jgi:hypothetical protein
METFIFHNFGWAPVSTLVVLLVVKVLQNTATYGIDIDFEPFTNTYYALLISMFTRLSSENSWPASQIAVLRYTIFNEIRKRRFFSIVWFRLQFTRTKYFERAVALLQNLKI